MGAVRRDKFLFNFLDEVGPGSSTWDEVAGLAWKSG